MTARRSDEGSILPLTAFFAFLGLLVILVVVAATSLYLERARLYTLADGAALVGAEAFELDAVARGPAGFRPTLRSVDVAAAASAYLAAQPTTLDSVRLDRAGSPDGVSAEVTVSGYWRPPVVTLLLPEGLRLEVTATARSVFD